MGTLIHMEPEELRTLSVRMEIMADLIEERAHIFSRSLSCLDWYGPTRDEIVEDAQNLARDCKRQAEHLMLLGNRLKLEVNEWVNTDQYPDSQSSVIGTVETVRKSIAEWFTRAEEGIHEAVARFQIYQAWQGMSSEERLEFLNQEQIRLAKRMGIEPVKISIENLEDKVGDTRGVNQGNVIVIDSDNFKSDHPAQLLETMAHETRHSFQMHITQSPEALPPGISEEQISRWRENLQSENYIQPDNDPEGYYNQPVEIDARSFADDFIHEYLMNYNAGQSSGNGGGV